MRGMRPKVLVYLLQILYTNLKQTRGQGASGITVEEYICDVDTCEEDDLAD